MVTIDEVKKLSLSFPETTEQDHFERPSFRVKKKIFAVLHTKDKRVVLKLSLIDQDIFSAYDNTIIYPIPGAWGKQGWTFVELQKVRKYMFKDALTLSYCEVAPKKLSEKYLKK